MVCPKCSAINEDDSLFCVQCGERLSAPAKLALRGKSKSKKKVVVLSGIAAVVVIAAVLLIVVFAGKGKSSTANIQKSDVGVTTTVQSDENSNSGSFMLPNGVKFGDSKADIVANDKSLYYAGIKDGYEQYMGEGMQFPFIGIQRSDIAEPDEQTVLYEFADGKLDRIEIVFKLNSTQAVARFETEVRKEFKVLDEKINGGWYAGTRNDVAILFGTKDKTILLWLKGE